MFCNRGALIWGLAIIGLAILAAVGVVDQDAAAPVVLALPVIAWLSLKQGSGNSCAEPREERR